MDFIKFCNNCDKPTNHKTILKFDGSRRLFLAMLTLGVSEIWNNKECRCKVCGNVKPL